MPAEESGKKDTKQGTNAHPVSDARAAAPANAGMAAGSPIDDVGGAGMGQPAGHGETPAGGWPPEKKAADVQDGRDRHS